MAGKRKHTGKKKKKKGPSFAKLCLRVLAVVFLLLLVYLGIPYFTPLPSRNSGAALPIGAKHLGIDLSHYQSRVEWDSLRVLVDAGGRTVRDIRSADKVYPVEFVFIKATEGEGMKDAGFAGHWEAAGRAGIPRGAYHFFRSSRNPLRQAENFISTVGDLGKDDLPPVLDIESMHRGCTKEQLNSAVLVWLETVGNHYGVKPVVYASDSYLREVLSSEVKKYPIWVAHYKTPSPLYLNWTYWQFTDEAVVSGIPGKVDLSVRR